MKICLIRTGEIKSRQRIRIDAFCEFRGASVYTLTVDGNLRERRFGKALGKGISELRKYGVTLFGAPSDLGIACAVSERELLLDLRARFAEAFSDATGENCDFLFVGGSMRRRIAAAVSLLRKRRTVYLSCADFEETAEEISLLTGATVGETPPGKFIEVDLSGGDAILRFGEKEITLSDFCFGFPWEKASELSVKENLTLVAMLEICGILRKKEIKVECFAK